MNKITNKKASLKCDRCYQYFRYTELYAIGQKFGIVCSRCWENTMKELINEKKKI